MRIAASIAIIGLLLACGKPAASAQPAAAATNPLEQKLDELDAIDRQLAEWEQQPTEAGYPRSGWPKEVPHAAGIRPTEASGKANRDAQRQKLKQKQIALLREIAAAIGEPDPLPNQPAATQAIRDNAQRILQQQMEQRQRHDDALLENNAARRTPGS